VQLQEKQEAKRLLFGPFAMARCGEGRVGEGGGGLRVRCLAFTGNSSRTNDIHYFM